MVYGRNVNLRLFSAAMTCAWTFGCQPPAPIVAPSDVPGPSAPTSAVAVAKNDADAAPPDGACEAFASVDAVCAAWVQALLADSETHLGVSTLQCDVATTTVAPDLQIHRLSLNVAHLCQRIGDGGWTEVGTLLVPRSWPDENKYSCRTGSHRLSLVVAEHHGLWPLEVEEEYSASNDADEHLAFTVERYHDGELTYRLDQSKTDTHHEAVAGNLEGERRYVHVELTPYGPIPRAEYVAGTRYHGYRPKDDCEAPTEGATIEDDEWRCYEFVELEFDSTVEYRDECSLEVQWTNRSRVGQRATWSSEAPSSAHIDMCCEPDCEEAPRCAEQVWSDAE